PPPHVLRQVDFAPSQPPHRAFWLGPVGPTRMRQPRELLPPRLLAGAGIRLPLELVRLVHPALQLGPVRTSPRLGPVLLHPLRPLNDTIGLRAAWRVPDQLQAQTDQPTGQLRGVAVIGPPGNAVVHANPAR